jgi:hypothetical protein
LQDEAHSISFAWAPLLERADNTARILDVKYHVLRPHGEDEGATDFYQWGALLRSVSAFEVYRKAYRDVITPERVAELLILQHGHAAFAAFLPERRGQESRSDRQQAVD